MVDSDTRGILTDADKEWLRGEKDYNQRQTEAKRRHQIRERVALALQDFQLLAEQWSTEEMEKVMDEVDAEACAEDVIEFLYVAMQEHAQDLDHIFENGAPDRSLAFRRALSEGIRNGKQHFGDDPGSVAVASNTDLFELPDVDEIKDELETGQWRAANNRQQSSITGDEDENIWTDEAAESYQAQMRTNIAAEVYNRHSAVDQEFKIFDTYPGTMDLDLHKLEEE